MPEVSIPSALTEFPGFFPIGTGEKLFHLSREKVLAHYERTCDPTKLEESFWVPDVCRDPAGIWVNLDRPHETDSYCYSGVPDGTFAARYRPDLGQFPPNWVLLVYVRRDWSIRDWVLCAPATDNPLFPENYASRFGEQKWPSTTWQRL